MWWNKIIGQKKIVNQLKYVIKVNRIPHAQMFIGESGYGSLALAIAFASEVLYRENIKNKFKIMNLMHFDLHFLFPTIKKVNCDAVSHNFCNDWIKFINNNIYASLQDWYYFIGNKTHQGFINVKDIDSISNKIVLKSLEGKSRFIIIWMMDKMNEVASNKFLKLLEEPPKDTYFILLVDDENLVLKTIISRCQIMYIPPINDEDIYIKLNEINAKIINQNDENMMNKLIYQSNGNWNKVMELLHQIDENIKFEEYLISWLRFSFQITKKPQMLNQLYRLALVLSELGKEKQKRFLNYVLEVFRQAYIYNFNVKSLNKFKLSKYNFNWVIFTKHVNHNNISLILEEISKSFYYIERNANSKILFLNLLISFNRFFNLVE